MCKRLISLNKEPNRSFFLWGPRQSGKSTLLRALYPNAKYIDLLQSNVFASYVQALLRELDTDAGVIVIDEVQKIPELLDEVHWCIENQKRVFALCGSSARKLKRGHANLLGGREYFNILIDTLIAWYLPLYRHRPKRKAAASTKFYFADVGVVNLLAKRHLIEPVSELFGKAFENWVAHELRCYNQYRDHFHDLSYWLSDSDDEVAFLVGDYICGIEAKGASRLRDEHYRGLKALGREHPEIKQRVLVFYEGESLRREDGIRVLNHRDFIRELWAGNLF